MEEVDPNSEFDYDEYVKYMDYEKKLDEAVSSLDFGNIHIFAQKLKEKDKELSKKLIEELKWQTI